MTDDRIISGAAAPGVDAAVLMEGMSPYEVFHRVGELTRKLHDFLQALGDHNDVKDALGSLPDARSRLNYVARTDRKSCRARAECSRSRAFDPIRTGSSGARV